MNLADELRSLNLEGDVENSEEVLAEYSHDTSIFEVVPEVVVFPKHRRDIELLVKWVSGQKIQGRNVSLTARSAGTDMTGGPLTESIVVSTIRYMNSCEIKKEELIALVEPGLYYREFEKNILPTDLTMPTYPSSKTIAALGGMIMNNCGGERTLKYGQMREYVNTVDMTLSDGVTYTFGPLNESELAAKLALQTFEGGLYRQLHELVISNQETIIRNTPKTSKNSSGYALWRVWDKKTKIFNLAHLFVGSQGTLGILEKASIKIQKDPHEKKMIVTFFKNWNSMPNFVNEILPYKPESLEAFDDATLKLGLRFMPEVARSIGQSFIPFALKFIPEVWVGIKMLSMPKLVIIIELAEMNTDTLDRKVQEIEALLKEKKYAFRTLQNEDEENKYWAMRRESFNLLRKHVNGKHTAPFIEDFCLQPKDVPQFLPEVKKLLDEYGITMNIAGHAGNGNFHIIPLMDLTKSYERDKIPVVAEKFYALVKKYNGSISAEHNDGLMRTPFLSYMFDEEMLGIFKKVKEILDPLTIFNPGKKNVSNEGIGSKMYLKKHIRNSF